MSVQRTAVRHRGPRQDDAAAVAARLHDQFGRDRRRLYACRGPGARRRHQDRHQRPHGGDAKVKVPGGDMPVYFARPADVANPPVILVAMEIFGLHEYIRDVTRRLGHLGALAIAPDYYFRDGVDLTKIDDLAKLLPIVNTKPDAELFADLDATVDWAKPQGGDTSRLGIMGFCRGGRTVWLYSTHNPNLKAGVAFYGTLRTRQTPCRRTRSTSPPR